MKKSILLILFILLLSTSAFAKSDQFKLKKIDKNLDYNELANHFLLEAYYKANSYEESKRYALLSIASALIELNRNNKKKTKGLK